jgi:hypothetical protein
MGISRARIRTRANLNRYAVTVVELGRASPRSYECRRVPDRVQPAASCGWLPRCQPSHPRQPSPAAEFPEEGSEAAVAVVVQACRKPVRQLPVRSVPQASRSRQLWIATSMTQLGVPSPSRPIFGRWIDLRFEALLQAQRSVCWRCREAVEASLSCCLLLCRS